MRSAIKKKMEQVARDRGVLLEFIGKSTGEQRRTAQGLWLSVIYPELHSFAKSFRASEEQAEEAVSAATMAIMKQISKGLEIDNEESMRKYVYVVLRGETRRLFGDSKKRKPLFYPNSDVRRDSAVDVLMHETAPDQRRNGVPLVDGEGAGEEAESS
jgi:hypothetical protein